MYCFVNTTFSLLLESSKRLHTNSRRLLEYRMPKYNTMSPIYHTNQTQQKFNTAFKEFTIIFIVGPTGGGKTFLLNLYARKYQYTLLRIEARGTNKRLPLKELEEDFLHTDKSEETRKTESSSDKEDGESLSNSQYYSKTKHMICRNKKVTKRLPLCKFKEENRISEIDGISESDFDDIPLHLNQTHIINLIEVFETDDYAELKTFLMERKQEKPETNKLIIETRNPNLKKLVLNNFPFATILSVPGITKIRMKKYNILDSNLHTLNFHKKFLRTFYSKEQVDINEGEGSDDNISIFGDVIVSFNRTLARLFNGRASFKNVDVFAFPKIFEYIYENYVNTIFASCDVEEEEEISCDIPQGVSLSTVVSQVSDNLKTCRDIIEILSNSAHYESAMHKVTTNQDTYFSDTCGLSISFFHLIMSRRKGFRKFVSPNDYFKTFNKK